MSNEMALLLVGATVLLGAGAGVALWFWFIKPVVEKSEQRREEDIRPIKPEMNDFGAIQGEAERIKEAAINIRDRVTRLQQLAAVREKAMKDQDAKRGQT